MKFYEVTIILDGKQQERLENLAKRFKEINGWDEWVSCSLLLMVLPIAGKICLLLWKRKRSS